MRKAIWIVPLVFAVGCQSEMKPRQGPAEPASPQVGATVHDGPASGDVVDQPSANGQVMALVNSKPIYMDALHRMLLRDYGMQAAQQLIASELVRQEADKYGYAVTEADVRQAHEETLENMLPSATAEQREQLLEHLLAQNRVSREQWNMIMTRNALLARLAERQITITPDDLKNEFGRQYGRKVVVRHIQTPTLNDAQDLLKKVKAGPDFRELARELSTNASAADGGLLPPIGQDTDGVPPAIQQAALAMKEVGEISQPIQAGTAFHILYLESIIEPQDVRMEEVKDELIQVIRRRQSKTLQQEILQQLITEATNADSIRFVDPILKSQADEKRAADQ